MAKKKKRKKMEFSKKIFYIVISLFITVIIYSMALMWKTESTEALSFLIPSIGGLASVAVGFYYWKAKMENVIKLSKDNEMTIDEVKEVNDDLDDFNVDSNDM